jgi:hypothetical protein
MALGAFKKLQVDDWIMVVVLTPFTALIVLTNLVARSTTVEAVIYRFVLENMQIITVWLVKACLLVLYWRILSAFSPNP